eukprot:GHVS01042856.1.p1 GENE.GHVS01042856.1~~GHVS01042856.1.p1  ORF type:complete len:301 (+),score=50.81 GHVS01042856.1:432-1334(+)
MDEAESSDEIWSPSPPPESAHVLPETGGSPIFTIPVTPPIAPLDSWDRLRSGEGGDGEEEDGGEEDNVDVPDIEKTYRNRMRKRIRRRRGAVVENPERMRDVINDDLGEEITQEDSELARRSAWQPHGSHLPDLCDIAMGYRAAWDVGRRGCFASMLNGLWDSQLGPTNNRFFVMDGTDPDCFLNFYTKSKTSAARGRGPEYEKSGTIGAYDLRDGYWDYKGCKVYIQRSDLGDKDTVLTKLSRNFVDAMLICIWEMEIRTYIERLKAQRLDTRRRRQSKKTTGNTTKLPSRLTVHVPCD